MWVEAGPEALLEEVDDVLRYLARRACRIGRLSVLWCVAILAVVVPLTPAAFKCRSTG